MSASPVNSNTGSPLSDLSGTTGLGALGTAAALAATGGATGSQIPLEPTGSDASTSFPLWLQQFYYNNDTAAAKIEAMQSAGSTGALSWNFRPSRNVMT